MILHEVIKNGIERLKLSNIETPAVDAGVLLCYLLNKDRAFIYSHGDIEIGEAVEKQYFHLINSRAEGAPVQYLTGSQEFMSLPFNVTKDVLIPRGDTEVLAETVINHVQQSGKPDAEILDIGTGSGCIAVSLAHYLGKSIITAVDISENALNIARGNATAIGVADRINFVKSDLFGSLFNGGKPCKTFDIIVSNPPYIPAGDIENLQREVRNFEPSQALDGGVDGLDFYRRIIHGSVDFIKPGGMLAFEVGYDQAGDVCTIMKDYYINIEVTKDYSGIERVVSGICELK